MNELKLSILVPVYKAERYLEECLRSLFEQDIPMETYEVVAVDNGSPDGSADIIKRLQKEYTNLRLVTLKENQLPSGGRNAAMDAAKGKYIMFVDADDYLYPNVLGRLIKEIEKEDLDFVHFSNDTLCEGKITKEPSLATTPVMTGASLYFEDIKTQGVSWSKIYKRAFIEEHALRNNQSILYEDDEFAFRLYAYAQRVKHIQFNPYVYRANPYSATRNRINMLSMESDMNEIQVVERNIRVFKKRGVDKRLIDQMGRYIRYMIQECYRLYHLFPKEQQPEVLALYRRSLCWRHLPYMSVKKFVLLKIGIIQ